MSDIAPNERPTDEQMRRAEAMERARWDARDVLLRREPTEIFDTGFDAGLAAAHPVPEDAREATKAAVKAWLDAGGSDRRAPEDLFIAIYEAGVAARFSSGGAA